jgi:hypothetical protein
MMYELEKSDLCIVAKKPANDGAGSTSELVERRRRAKGNMGKTCAHRTLSRASVSPGLPVYESEQDGCSLCRHSPKVGAECPNRARSVLCGGRPAMGVPTAILQSRCTSASGNGRSILAMPSACADARREDLDREP